ncbi:MAG TPA: hypothetical protein DCM27_01585 [Rhodospirillaceae bacterium]|nr:hypothetical protein [Rhodospirillaceae bacterium]
MSLRQVTIGSIAMSSVGILRMVAQMAVIPILARYVTPHDYGIIAIAMPFVFFAMMFSDAGITASLLRSHHKQQSEWSTSFWFIVCMGAFLSLTITLSGYLLSIFMKQDILFPVIAFLSLSILLQSFATVTGASLQQHNKYTTIAYIEIASIFCSLLLTVLAAIKGYGVWALAVQQVTHFTVKLVFTTICSPFRPHFIFRIREITDHLKFGRDMLGSNFLHFVRQSITNTVMGRVLGTSPVGIFSMASLFSDLPNRIISGPLQFVLYPRMAKTKDDPATIKALYVFVSRILSILVVPSIGMIAIAHEPVFTLVLSQKWQQAGHIFLLLAPAGILQSVTALRNTILMALGRTELLLRQTTEMTVILLVPFIVAVWFGLEWATIAISVSTLVCIPRFLYQILPLIDLSMKDYVKAIAVPVIFTAVSGGVYLVVEQFEMVMWEKFITAFVLGGIALCLSILGQLPQIKSEIHNLRTVLSPSTT